MTYENSENSFQVSYMLTKTQCFSYAMNLFVLVNHQSRANKQRTNIFSPEQGCRLPGN